MSSGWKAAGSFLAFAKYMPLWGWEKGFDGVTGRSPAQYRHHLITLGHHHSGDLLSGIWWAPHCAQLRETLPFDPSLVIS